MQVISLAEKLALFAEHWRPKVIAEVNGAELKLVKLQGEFIFHHHEEAEEAFLCLAGEMEIDLGEETHLLRPGELFVVPRGARHRTRAKEEAHVLIIAPKGLRNTGGELHADLTAPSGVRI